MYDAPAALVAAINGVPRAALETLHAYYRDRQGVIVDLRKYVLARRLEGHPVALAELEQRVAEARGATPVRFKNYKTLYSIFFPLVTAGQEEPMRFLRAFVEAVIRALDLEGRVRFTMSDFQGTRQLGSDRLWFSIFHASHKHHAGAIQLHAVIHDGMIAFGVYRHPAQFLGGPVTRDLADFDPTELIRLFLEGRELIEQDILTEENFLLEITLGSARLFQLELAEAPRLIGPGFEYLLFPESAAAELVERFRNSLQPGDYVFVSMGAGTTPVALARVASPEWDFLPEEIAGPGWLSKNVEYLRFSPTATALAAEPGAPSLTELPRVRLDEFNDRWFEPHFLVRFTGAADDPGPAGEHATAPLAEQPAPVATPHNIILYGPPGTGKTYYTRLYALALANNGEASRDTVAELYRLRAHDAAEFERRWRRLEGEGRLEFLTFHPSTTYEDFVQGVAPDVRAAELKFFRRDGLFKQLADRARANWDQAAHVPDALRHFVLIVDEINRANLGRVFGELITLLEPDKRLGRPDAVTVRLPSGESFALSPNLHLIGTMNTADRSLSQVDLALRRRFEFVGFYPTAEVLDSIAPDLLDPASRRLLEQLNQAIYRKKHGADFLIGHAYFLRRPGQLDFSREAVLERAIIPLLLEYFGGRIDEVEAVLAETDLPYRFDERTMQWVAG